MSSRELFNNFLDLSRAGSRRSFLKQAGALGVSATAFGAFLQACGGGNSSSGTGAGAAPNPANLAGPIDLKTLAENAKKEGKLEAIGIPPEWADYKDILAGYTKNYGVDVAYKAEAEFSSAQELEVFKKSKQHPHGDIGDVGFSFGPTVISQGLVSPYKHAHWDDIEDDLKDPQGNWCTEYWGAQAFVINTDLVKKPPTSFKELLAGDYKNMVGIDGDPRQATDAFNAVYAAALATSGSIDNIQPGIDYFVQLKKKGSFTVARSSLANITKGEVAIAIMWDYLGLGFRDQLNGKPNIKVVIPSDGSIAGPYVSIINKTAPHPYAARLWNEYIFSDEGQLFYLTGYAHPARYKKLVAAGKVPADLAAKLPPAEQYNSVKFVSDPAKLKAATDLVNQNWQSQVLGQ
ncbi:extracellular solute-binding protein [Ktedonosporobacter rubrisoli]|uniref:Extracellular solute-binding protein n=1 Tax=Ktedonosporobacter rubrisoli TaxID=2509675 RepID=A0A4P6K5T0_KTERU|nr:ABC transporter substrate-binding protein [Ktedonosporobacter rubrisoli]QBD83728.1 extracellular solute-binding protein [Ktedonosporobacter rubrisoli]